MKRLIVLFVMLFAWLQTAQAGGFQIGEMATRASGMGNAFTAVADDASAAWYNPAGVAYTDGANVMLGGAAIISPGVDFTPNAFSIPGQAATSSKSKTFFVPHAYFTYWDENSRIGAAISVNAPFGLETDWTAPLTSIAAGNLIPFSNTFSRISAVNINPSVIFKMTDNISVAGGFSYTYLNKVNLNNFFQELEGKNKDGWGGVASIFVKADQLSFGVTYRSRIKIDINGGNIVPGLAFAGTPTALLRATGNTSITLPDMVNVGGAWQVNDQFRLSVDVDWVNWKTFKEIRLVYSPSPLSTILTGGTNLVVLPQNWKDTVAIRVGAEWDYSPSMSARIGYVYDPTPIKDVDFSPAIPGNDRHIFSVGYSYSFTPDTVVDLAYAYVHFMKRNQTQSVATPTAPFNPVRNGTYKNSAHIAMASLRHHF